MASSKVNRTLLSDKWLFGSMAVFSAIGLIVSFILSIDAWKIASQPNVILNCDLSSVISCGKVARTWQASLLGFPNAFLGILFESVVLTVSLSKILGSHFSRVLMSLLQLFYTCAIIFALWLFYQSAFVIHVFCPFCLIITVTTIFEWFDLLRVNSKDNSLVLPPIVNKKIATIVKNNIDILTSFLLIVSIALVIIVNYGSTIF